MKKLMMSSLIRAAQIRESARDDRGGVAAEYGVLLAGIVGVVAIAAAALRSGPSRAVTWMEQRAEGVV